MFPYLYREKALIKKKKENILENPVWRLWVAHFYALEGGFSKPIKHM